MRRGRDVVDDREEVEHNLWPVVPLMSLLGNRHPFSNIIIGSIFIGSKSGISRFRYLSLRCGLSIARVRAHKRKTHIWGQQSSS